MYSYPDIDWDGLRKYRTERVAQVDEGRQR